VFAKNAALADAAAIRAANVVVGPPGEDVRVGVKSALSVQGVYGVYAQRDGYISTGGWIPPIVRLGEDP